MLGFKTLQGTQLWWPLSEDIVSQIPPYESAVARKRAQAGNTTRLVISDDIRRSEVRMLDVMEFLTTGNVTSVHGTEDEDSLRNYMTQFLTLSGLAKSLEVTSLVDKIGGWISEHQSLRAASFAELAERCCYQEYGVDVSRDSVVGRWMRTNLATHMAELERGGHIGRITEKGGRLMIAILVEVLMETRTQQQGLGV